MRAPNRAARAAVVKLTYSEGISSQAGRALAVPRDAATTLANCYVAAAFLKQRVARVLLTLTRCEADDNAMCKIFHPAKLFLQLPGATDGASRCFQSFASLAWALLYN